jgi:hypothetical protein
MTDTTNTLPADHFRDATKKVEKRPIDKPSEIFMEFPDDTGLDTIEGWITTMNYLGFYLFESHRTNGTYRFKPKERP